MNPLSRREREGPAAKRWEGEGVKLAYLTPLAFGESTSGRVEPSGGRFASGRSQGRG